MEGEPLAVVGTNPPHEGVSPQAVRALQESTAHIKYIVIDEFSMLGCEKLWQLAHICQQIRPRAGSHFGGFSVILCGDQGQLACVAQQPLFVKPPDATAPAATVAGHAIFKDFVNVVWLRANHRQANDLPLCAALAGLKNGPLTAEHHAMFMTRVPGVAGSTVTEQQWAAARAFTNTYWSAGTTAEVTEINKAYLRSLTDAGAGMAVIRAVQSRAAARMPASSFAGVASVLTLVDGCAVQVRRNVCTTAGVVNGASGTIVGVLYDAAAAAAAAPRVVFVNLPSYRGTRFPHLPAEWPGTVVPLQPVSLSVGTGTARRTRLQFPLSIDAACTIHKLQGATITGRTLCVQIGEREFSPGLSYVALSRTTLLAELVIASSVSHARRLGLGVGVRVRVRVRVRVWVRG